MIAIDTNVLIYAHRIESPWYLAAHACVETLWSGERRWAIPLPCLHEFYAVVTSKKAYTPPTSSKRALEQVDEWLASDSIVIVGEGDGHWPLVKELAARSGVTGSKIYDAKIAAICLQSGVTTLWTADRDYSRFPALHCENPLVR